MILFDDADFSERTRIDLFVSAENNIQILRTTMSHDNKYLSVCVGEKLIKDEVRVVGIVILNRIRKKDNKNNKILSFQVFKEINFEKLKLFNVCKYMYFDSNNSENMIMIANQICMKFNIIGCFTQCIYRL